MDTNLAGIPNPVQMVLWQRMPGRIAREEALLMEEARKRGVPVLTASEKQMARGKVPLVSGAVAAGTVPFVAHALRRSGAAVPDHIPYPEVLQPWLHRAVARRERLSDVLREVAGGMGRVFVKPASGWKRFTGFVLEHDSDHRLHGIAKALPVWTSEPVVFVSEWRVYVVGGKVLDVRFADHGGDRQARPDMSVVEAAVGTLVDAGQAPEGFVIDFGVLVDGRTALIEVNDGFAFGAYDGVGADVVWDVTVARWQELVRGGQIYEAGELKAI